MKKSKIFIVGLSALLMIGGLILAGCDALFGKKSESQCVGDGDCYFNGQGEPFKWCGSGGCATATQNYSTCDCS